MEIDILQRRLHELEHRDERRGHVLDNMLSRTANLYAGSSPTHASISPTPLDRPISADNAREFMALRRESGAYPRTDSAAEITHRRQSITLRGDSLATPRPEPPAQPWTPDGSPAPRGNRSSPRGKAHAAPMVILISHLKL